MSRQKTLGPATRDAYGEALAELGKENSAVVVVDGDVSGSSKSRVFAKAFPNRFYNCGIAEANMVGIAAGLASSGKIPFASTFATFMISKTFDQLRMGVANPRLNVKLCGSHSGISLGQDGASQMAIEDLALACSLPGMVVVSPADSVATKALVHAAAAHDGPVYIRTGRPKAPVIYQPGDSFSIGKAKTVQQGNDATIIATGLLVWEALEAADLCAAKSISVRVIDMHTIKPLDDAAIAQAANETGAIVTAEEHLLHGGLGSRVAQVITRTRPVPIEYIGLNDTYAESGKPDELFERYKLTAPHLAAAIERAIKRK